MVTEREVRYRVKAIAQNFPVRQRRFDHVPLIFFREDAKGTYEEAAWNELFSVEEAAALVAWLLRSYGDGGEEVTIKPMEPSSDCIPIGAIPAGGASDFYMFTEEDHYDLPFRAWGYYELDDPETVIRAPEMEAVPFE